MLLGRIIFYLEIKAINMVHGVVFLTLAIFTAVVVIMLRGLVSDEMLISFSLLYVSVMIGSGGVPSDPCVIVSPGDEQLKISNVLHLSGSLVEGGSMAMVIVIRRISGVAEVVKVGVIITVCVVISKDTREIIDYALQVAEVAVDRITNSKVGYALTNGNKGRRKCSEENIKYIK